MFCARVRVGWHVLVELGFVFGGEKLHGCGCVGRFREMLSLSSSWWLSLVVAKELKWLCIW